VFCSFWKKKQQQQQQQKKQFSELLFPWPEGEEVFQLSIPIQGGIKHWNISSETECVGFLFSTLFLYLQVRKKVRTGQKAEMVMETGK